MTEAIVVTLVPEEDCFQDLLTILGRVLEETRAFAGCRMAHVYHCETQNEIVLVQMWQNSEAHDGYLNWRAEQGVFEELTPLLAKEQIHKSYRAL